MGAVCRTDGCGQGRTVGILSICPTCMRRGFRPGLAANSRCKGMAYFRAILVGFSFGFTLCWRGEAGFGLLGWVVVLGDKGEELHRNREKSPQDYQGTLNSIYFIVNNETFCFKDNQFRRNKLSKSRDSRNILS